MAFPFVQLLINSLVIGSIYALVAVGFSLIFQAGRFMHLAHGGVVAIGAYLTLLFFSTMGLPFAVAAVLSITLSSATGYIMYVLVYDPLQKKKSSNVILLITGLALLILLESIILLFFGSDVKSLDLLPVQEGIAIMNATITPLQMVIILVSLLLMAVTYLCMNYTSIGRNLRAVSNNPELAEIMGLDSKKFIAISFIIGSAIAGVAGILIGLEQQLTPIMGTPLMIKGFSGAVIGGVTSIPASIAGSYLVGIAENFGVWWIPSGYKDAITFGLLFIFLLFRPQGIFGKNLNRT